MSKTSNCPNCNKPISEEDRFCRFCGSKLISNELEEKKLIDDEEAVKEINVDGRMEIGNKNNSNKFSLSIGFALLGAVFYILSNDRFQTNLMRMDSYVMKDMPGFITTVILMFIIGLIVGSVSDKQKK